MHLIDILRAKHLFFIISACSVIKTHMVTSNSYSAFKATLVQK